MAAKQSRHRQGIWGPMIVADQGTEEIEYPCFMPEWLETDRTSRMTVLGAVQITDKTGRRHWVAAAANARVTMILEGALLKVSHSGEEIVVRAGDSFSAPLRISRSAKLQLPVVVEVRPPDELRGLIEAEPLTVPVAANDAQLNIQTRPGPRVQGVWPLTVVASTLQDGKWRVVSQCEILVDLREAN